MILTDGHMVASCGKQVLCQLGGDPHVVLPHVRFNGHTALSLAASKGHKAVLGQLVGSLE
jgi:hypothetical protein